MNDEVREAARQLLRTPLVVASLQPEEHRLIRRHFDELSSMFRKYLGYRLAVDARLARLYKAGLGEHEQRPLRRGSNAAFSVRDYTYLALVCSVLLSTGRQVLLSSLVADIKQAAAEAGIDVGRDTRNERLALVHALRQLIAWGALDEEDGSVDKYCEAASAEALLTIERDVVRELLSTPLRDLADPDALVRAAADVAPEAVRHRARRRMVECPVVLFGDLPEAERSWLRQSQRREAQLLEENFGLRLEIRGEGVAAFDPADELTDVSFPREGTVAQAALLTVSELVDLAGRTAIDSHLCPIAPKAISELASSLVTRHGRSWAKEYVAHPDRLAEDVEDLLVDAGLVDRREDGELALRAIAARYAPEATEVTNRPRSHDDEPLLLEAP
ncbi:MAG: TIGR02678 family protein [Acidimicrobiales bacterium]